MVWVLGEVEVDADTGKPSCPRGYIAREISCDGWRDDQRLFAGAVGRGPIADESDATVRRSPEAPEWRE